MRRIFFYEQNLISITSKLSCIVTFGVVFPPIAIIGFVSLVSETYCTQLSLGRYLHMMDAAMLACNQHDRVLCDHNHDHNQAVASLSSLNAELHQLHFDLSSFSSCVAQIWRPIIYTSALFYSFFVFDTIGDTGDLSNAIVALVIVAFFPIIVRLLLTVISNMKHCHCRYNMKTLASPRSQQSSSSQNKPQNDSLNNNHNNIINNNRNNRDYEESLDGMGSGYDERPREGSEITMVDLSYSLHSRTMSVMRDGVAAIPNDKTLNESQEQETTIINPIAIMM